MAARRSSEKVKTAPSTSGETSADFPSKGIKRKQSGLRK
ncbi:hypothetical protein AA0113_g10153 [Alternaria arborescens]|uniref:Uncharacterized protein n=1 Tax=Alternaria arborescens TaxID=156630 RepID=A0A4Q4QWN2_9PLEO|nr:hypothetical protein AA0111_g11084 [Alternaria arborescens]RYO17562.1 hypothetical protein AA0111_g11084 [Alternaria arborescens]RYO48147.1 hypothetical protein AA0113_g10153 [Alternaria arborescens]